MQYKINISIDDVSPHPKSSTKVLESCYKVIGEYPEVKFTLFVPINYTRLREKSYPLEGNPHFCEVLKKLSRKNFEIGYHGYYHGVLNKSNNDEFRDFSYEGAKQRFEMMLEATERAEVADVFKPIFRPPAWRMSPGSIRAAKDCGFEVLALSPDKYSDGSLDYKGEDKAFKNVVYYNACPPYKPLSLFEKTEIVYHACEWDKNYLNFDKADELIKFLKPNEEKITFCFMGDLL